LHQSDALARRLRLSRAQLIIRALKAFLAAHPPSGVTAALNRIYATESSRADRAFDRSLLDTLPDEAW